VSCAEFAGDGEYLLRVMTDEEKAKVRATGQDADHVSAPGICKKTFAAF